MSTLFYNLGILMTGFILASCAAQGNPTPEVPIQSLPEANVTTSTPSTSETASGNTVGNTATEEQISETEAKAIALNHAGLSEADVTFMKSKLEFDDGIWEYEIEFYVGDKEYDYDINASTGDIISFDYEMETSRPSSSSSNSNTGSNGDTSAQISETEAKAIALNHAGLSEADVTFLKSKLEFDDGIWEYEIEFYVGDKEYDYDINASTGDIISFDYEMETSRPSSGSTSSNADTSAQISETEAKAIALNHAGLSEADVTFMKSKLEFDDGVWEYEIEFYVGNQEYDYDINASTGDIISYDYDMETSRPSSGSSNSSSSSEVSITETEAKNIALNHAGFTEAEVSSLKCKLDLEDGIWEYEVEFKVGKVEYEYEIHGSTGTILGYDKD